MADDEFVGVPRREWLDTLAAVVRLDLLVTVAIAGVLLLMLALVRKGVLAWSDLAPMAAA